MSHTIAFRSSWFSMPRVLIPIGGVIAVAFLLFAAALGAERSSQGTLVEARADLVVAQEMATRRRCERRACDSSKRPRARRVRTATIG